MDLKSYKVAIVSFKWTKLSQYDICITINIRILIYFATLMDLYTTFVILRLNTEDRSYFNFADPLEPEGLAYHTTVRAKELSAS